MNKGIRISKVKKPTENRNLCLLLSIVLVFIIVLLIIFDSDTDHQYQCDKFPNHNSIPKFRTIDGSKYGTTTEEQFSRLLDDYYNWNNAPDTRDISNILSQDNNIFIKTMRGTTNMVWLWGQFLDHIITETEQNKNEILQVSSQLYPTFRSESIIDSTGVRQQINSLTPYIDASAVYGNNKELAWKLRERDGTGRLRVSKTPNVVDKDNNLLPIDQETGNYIAGDTRAGEHILLTSMHILWVREHNYWCDKLRYKHPDWSGDKLYNTVRHIISGEIQSITYREFLPVVLGSKNLYGRSPCYKGHSKRATIFNEFTTAAYRFGHTLVTDNLESRSPVTGEIEFSYELKDVFNESPVSPNGTLWKYGISGLLLGASKQESEKRDPKIVDSLRNLLFANNMVNFTIDLASLNIIRGRDHGIPSYQLLYKWASHRSFNSCFQLSESIELCRKLKQVYGKDNDIDAWVGIISERQRGNALLGIVGSEIVALQFALLRDTDPYFYLWDPVVLEYRAEIHNTRLSKIILRNTDIDPQYIKPDVFKL